MFSGFIFKLGHTGKLPEQRVACQDPPQLRMVMYMALDKQQALLGIDTAGQQQSKSFQTLLAQFYCFLAYRQGMQIRNKIGALIILLQLLPVAHRADIVAQRENAGGLDTAENNLFLFRFLCFLSDFFCQNEHSLNDY